MNFHDERDNLSRGDEAATRAGEHARPGCAYTGHAVVVARFASTRAVSSPRPTLRFPRRGLPPGGLRPSAPTSRGSGDMRGSPPRLGCVLLLSGQGRAAVGRVYRRTRSAGWPTGSTLRRAGSGSGGRSGRLSRCRWGRARQRVGERLGSAATAGEGAQNLVCAYIAAGVLTGLGANAAFGWWWPDPVLALGIAAIAVGRVARRGVARAAVRSPRSGLRLV